MKRLGILLGAALIVACGGPETTDPCASGCGEGFDCAAPGGQKACTVREGVVATVEVLAPADGDARKSPDWTVRCDAAAPQLVEVLARVTAGGGSAVELVLAPANGAFEATLPREFVRDVEGELEFRCVVRYGPTGFTLDVVSDPVSLLVDKTAPLPSYEPTDVWLEPRGVHTLTVSAVDRGNPPSGVARVRIEFEKESPIVIEGVPVNEKDYTFEVDLAAVGPTEAPFRIIAEDRAGNVGEVGAELLIDGTGPTVEPIADSWRRRNELVSVSAHVTSSGAAVTEVSAKHGQRTWELVEESGIWSVSIDAADISAAGAEGEVSIDITATDAMGNVTTAPAKVRIDDKAPTQQVSATALWTNKAIESVTVEITEAGVGMASDAVRWRAAGDTEACTQDVNVPGKYVCNVPTRVPSSTGVDEAYAFGIDATDGLGNKASFEGTLKVDRKPPTISHTPPTGWLKPVGTKQLVVTVSDGAPPSSLVASGRLNFATGSVSLAGTPTPSGFLFDVPLANLGVSEGTANYEVVALDYAGNEARAQGALKLDGTAPTVTPVADAAWYKRGTTISVQSIVASSGAPLTGVTMRKGAQSWVALANGPQWTASVASTDLAADGTEGPVELQIVATDEAGNETVAATALKIDGKGPTVELPALSDWVGGAETDVVVTVRDGGVGMSNGAVTWSTSGGALNGSCTKESAADQYRCKVGITVVNGNTDGAYAFVVRATDSLGNAGTGNGTLKVDKKGPSVVTPAVDGKWYRRGETVTVRMTIADEQAGLTGAQAPRLEVGATPSSTHTGTVDAQGVVTFSVNTNELATAGTVRASMSITFVVFDRLGNETRSPTTTLLRIDDAKPTVTGAPTIAYAGGRTSALRRDPAGTSLDRVTITVNTSDSGSGIAKESIRLAYTKNDGATERLAPANEAAPWSFVVDISSAEFNASSGALATTVELSDLAGNQGNPTIALVQVTRKLWVYDTGSGAAVVGAPALSGGRVYFTVSRAGSASIPNVYALSGDGALVQSRFVSGTPRTPISIASRTGTTTIRTAYLAYESGGAGYIDRIVVSGVATNPTSPCSPAGGMTPVFGALAVAGIPTSNPLAPATETAFASSSDGSLWALSGDCSFVRVDGTAGISSNVAVHGDGRVWVSGRYGKVANTRYTYSGFAAVSSATLSIVATEYPAGIALRADGTAVTSTKGSVHELSTLPARTGGADFSAYTKTAVAPPVLTASGGALFGSDDGYVFRNPPETGFPANLGAMVKGSPTLDADGRAYVVTEPGNVVAISTTGTTSWSYATGAGGVVTQSPTLSCQGVLYVGTTNGKLVALIADAPIGNTPWPKFQHDNRNTGNASTLVYSAGGVCLD